MKRKTNEIVADVCMYGNHASGYGYLAQLADGRILGDGEPRTETTATDNLVHACAAIRAAGYDRGNVRVFMPSGHRMAVTRVDHPGYYGELKWQQAFQYAVDAAKIVAAAEAVR